MFFTLMEKILIIILYIVLAIGVYYIFSKKWKKSNKEIVDRKKISKKPIFKSPEILDHSDLEPAENPFNFSSDDPKESKLQYLEMDDLPYKNDPNSNLSLEEKLKKSKLPDDIDDQLDRIINNN